MITGDNHEYLSSEAAFKKQEEEAGVRLPGGSLVSHQQRLHGWSCFTGVAAKLLHCRNQKSFRNKLHIFNHLHATERHPCLLSLNGASREIWPFAQLYYYICKNTRINKARCIFFAAFYKKEVEVTLSVSWFHAATHWDGCSTTTVEFCTQDWTHSTVIFSIILRKISVITILQLLIYENIKEKYLSLRLQCLSINCVVFNNLI